MGAWILRVKLVAQGLHSREQHLSPRIAFLLGYTVKILFRVFHAHAVRSSFLCPGSLLMVTGLT